MEKIRIGKDITFVWQVRKDGEALTAEDTANLTLEIAGRNGKFQRLPFEVRDNKIVAVWYGVKQTEVGAYRLTCWYNRGKVSESVVDVVWAVELVQYTTEESFDDLETVTIELEAGNLTFGALKGASAYEVAVAEGFVGTEAEWIASLKKPAEDAAADAEEAADKANAAAERVETAIEDAETATEAANTAASAAQSAATAATDSATAAEEAATHANSEAALATAAATEAHEKSIWAEDAAANAGNAATAANNAATNATNAAAAATEAATEVQTQGNYAKEQGDYAKAQGEYATEQGNYAKEQGEAVQGDIAAQNEKIAALEAVVADLETIAEGFVRVAGSSNPALNYKSYKFNEQGGFGRESVFSLFYPCLVGTALTGADTVGKILHVLNKLDYTHDIYGNVRKIDGSEGDVLITNIEPYYMIRGQHTIDGTDYDIFLVSREPFTWQGIEAEHVARFGWSPDYCVSHVDTDNVRRMHSVYNPDWDGSYTAPDGVVGKYVYAVDPDTGEITETFDPNATLLGGAGGLQTTDKALYTGEQEAMNNNNDTTKPVPWFNHTAEGCNIMQSLLLAEGGTFDAHKAALMGSGFSANDPATSAADWEAAGSNAKNGFRVIDANGEWKMFSLGSNIQSWWGKTAGFYPGQIVNSWRNPWRIMEANRAVSHAVQNGVHELEWFVFEGNLYKYRSIDGFAGTAQGEMTCVVWKKLSAQLGSAVVDPTDKTTSIAGNRAEILVSTALFHGMTTQVSPSWWTSGLVWTQDEDGNYTSWLERDQAELLVTPTGSKAVSENFNFEEVYEQVGDTLTKATGYYKNYHNEALMLPATNADKVGGGLHTYVGIYGYYSGTNAAAGQKLVRGFRRGNSAAIASLSPLFVGANVAPSYASSYLAFGTCCRIVENENRGA